MTTTFMMNTAKLSSAPSLWDKNQSIISSSDEEGILFETESVASAMNFLEKEDTEVSLHEDDFAIVRAADPEVAEKFQMSLGSLYRSKSPGSSGRRNQSIELVAQFSKSMPDFTEKDLLIDKKERSSLLFTTKQHGLAENNRFNSHTLLKSSFHSSKEEDIFSSSAYRNATSFYGSKQDVFASPEDIQDESSSCTSSKDDFFYSTEPTPVSGPKLKQKNLVKNIAPAPKAGIVDTRKKLPVPKRTGPPTPSRQRAPTVATTQSPMKKKAPKDAEGPRAKSISPTRRRVSSSTMPVNQKSRSLSLKLGQDTTSMSPALSEKQKQLIKDKFLRSLLSDASQQRISGTHSVSTSLTPVDVADAVGNISHLKSPATTGGRGKKKSDLWKKLQLDKAVSLPLSSSVCDGTTVTTSTSTKSTSSKAQPISKQKRVIKIRKSDLETSGQEKRVNLDDLLDKAANEWKTTREQSSTASGTKWKVSLGSTANSVSYSKSDERSKSAHTAPSAVANNKIEKSRDPSRSRRGKRTDAVEKDTQTKSKVEKSRDLSRSRRTARVAADEMDIETKNDVKSLPTRMEKSRDSSRSRRTARVNSDEKNVETKNGIKSLSKMIEKSRDSSRSRRTKHVDTDEMGIETQDAVKSLSNKKEKSRDSSRSRRRSLRSYQILPSADDNGSKDNSSKASGTRDRNKSRRKSRTTLNQLQPDRRKSIFNELKALAVSPRKVERSSLSTGTNDIAKRSSLMASVAKTFGSERKERSKSVPRLFGASLDREKQSSRRSVSNPRSLRAATASTSNELKREPFSFSSLQGLQKMLGLNSSNHKNETTAVTSSDLLEYPQSQTNHVKDKLLERIRHAGVTDAVLRALSEEGLVIVERKAS